MKWFYKYAVIIITILFSEVFNAIALKILGQYKSKQTPYQSTALSMLVLVCVFYPAFYFLNKYLKKTSGKFLNKSGKLVGGNIVGRIFAFIVALLIIHQTLTFIVYNRNIFSDCFNVLF